MPLDPEFRHHLHELMVETSDKLRDEINQHKRKLIWEAQQTHNAAAVPNAYSKASIYAFRTRVSATIASYMGALEALGIDVDNSVELEMLAAISQLTSAAPSLSLPPGLKPPNISSIQRAHKMELMRIGNSLRREAANRLRELKMKAPPTRARKNEIHHDAHRTVYDCLGGQNARRSEEAACPRAGITPAQKADTYRATSTRDRWL